MQHPMINKILSPHNLTPNYLLLNNTNLIIFLTSMAICDQQDNNNNYQE